MRSVPFFDYPRAYLDDRTEVLDIIDKVASKGAFIMQQDLVHLESNFSDYTGSKFSVGVANATDGLELSWIAIGLNPGDEVICCAHTMLATASAIVTAGGVPIPVDLGDDNLIDPEAVENAITDNTVGIMPTQLNGRTCDMDKIMGLASKHDLSVVEDAAQALGSRFKGQHAGTFGQAAAFSFFPAKVLGCLGDGGIVITNSSDIYEIIYELHDHGRGIHGEVKRWGRNSRLDNIQAAILNFRLSSYATVIARRRAIAAMYNEGLGDVKEIKLPPAPNDDGVHFDVYQNYELEAENRDELKQYLTEHGIGTLIQWGGKALNQFEHLGMVYSLPKVEAFFQKCIMLPMNTFINDEDVQYVCMKVKDFYSK